MNRVEVLDRYPRFIEIIRKSRPRTPIVVTTAFAVLPQKSPNACGLEATRAAIRQVVARCRRAGDRNITVFEGLRQFDETMRFATVDGIHCNTLGFHLMAKALRPHLARVLCQNQHVSLQHRQVRLS